MSPLKADVIINDCVNTVSVSVGKPSTGPSRPINIYLEAVPGCKPTKIGQYVATALFNCYGLVRCFDTELVPVAKCVTLAGCQATALADYLEWTGIQLVTD